MSGGTSYMKSLVMQSVLTLGLRIRIQFVHVRELGSYLYQIAWFSLSLPPSVA